MFTYKVEPPERVNYFFAVAHDGANYGGYGPQWRTHIYPTEENGGVAYCGRKGYALHPKRPTSRKELCRGCVEHFLIYRDSLPRLRP